MKKIFSRNIRTSSLLIFAFVIIGGFLFFGGAKGVKAETCQCSSKYANGNPWTFTGTANTDAGCNQFCLSNGGVGTTYIFGSNGSATTNVNNTTSNRAAGTVTGTDNNGRKFDNKPTTDSCIFLWSPIVCTLLAILKIFGWLLSASAAIFAWAVDAASLIKVINNSNIYDSWKIVRDLLNISFILVLLYTAFTIIFQVDSTNKKIILTVVLMALLVNFSFPITRFIIDVGNSLMYTIFQHLLPTTDTIFSNFAKESAIGKIIAETNDSSSVAQILGAIIFVAILTITFLMMAILFVIRIVALAIIIIFSPFGFVGTLFPSLSSKIDWWGNLFKYTFFGPAMAFMIFIATKVMKGAIVAQNSNSAFAKFGQDMNGGSLVVGFSNFAIPVVILWIGMGLAQKMGIEGASMAQGWATKAWKFAAMAPAKTAWWGFKKTGVPAGIKQRYDTFKKTGFLGSDRVEERAAGIAAIGSGNKIGKFLGGNGLANDSLFLKRIKEAGEKRDTANMLTHELQNLTRTGNRFEQGAAMLELANRGQATQTELDTMRTTFGETSQAFRQLQAKVKTYDPVAAFAHLTPMQQEDNFNDFINSNQFDIKKIGANSLGNTHFMERAFENKAVSTKDILEASKSSAVKKRALDTSLASLTATRNVVGDAIDNNINMAYFAQTGKIATDGFATHIGKNLDKDTSANINWMKLTANQRRDISTNIKRNQIKNIADGIKDDRSARNLIRHLKYAGHRDYINNNPALKNF